KSYNSESSSEGEEDEEEYEDDSKSVKSYEGIKEEMVPPKYLMKSDDITNPKHFFNDGFSEDDTRSKISSSISNYSNNNKDFSKKNNSLSLHSVKIPTEKLHSLSNLSEMSFPQTSPSLNSIPNIVQPRLSFNNLLKYDFIRRKRDELKRLDYLCNNITKEQYEKKENLSIFIHSNPKH
ncbi:hypothetical protein PIROE2DRAFT_17422, partial [Piromyces sp. E2]